MADRNRDPHVQRLSDLAVASQRGPLSALQVVELGRLVIEVGGMAGAGQVRAKDRRIEAQRAEIGRLERRVRELEAAEKGRAA